MASRCAGTAINTHPGRRCLVGLSRCRYRGCEPAFSAEGLAELSYIPGKSIILEERYAGDIAARFDTLAAELVALKADVLVGQASVATYALHRATSTIPIVFVGVGDLVAQGLTASLSRPGGNLSGISQMAVISLQSVCGSSRRRSRQYRMWLSSVTRHMPLRIQNCRSTSTPRRNWDGRMRCLTSQPGMISIRHSKEWRINIFRQRSFSTRTYFSRKESEYPPWAEISSGCDGTIQIFHRDWFIVVVRRRFSHTLAQRGSLR